MAKHGIFYALCDLFNEGEAVVSMNDAKQVMTAAQYALPEFTVRPGLYDPCDETIELHVENFKQAKEDEND